MIAESFIFLSFTSFSHSRSFLLTMALQGDHVRVIGGRYEGDTGLIVRVLDNLIVLFSDLTMHELKVLPRDLQLCTDMATGVDSLGQFQFGDMVQIDAQTVGVIVQIQKENFQVISGVWCGRGGQFKRF